jgi:hypothetical protein
MNRHHGIRALAALAAVALLAACTPKPADLKLAIPVNALCTTCDDFLRCEAAGATDGSFQLLHLENKTFLAQVATIWDFLVQAIRERKEDIRPLAIYSSAGGPARRGANAVTDLIQHRINIPDGWIDQANGEWHGTDGLVKGQCTLLPLPEGRELVKKMRAAAQ